MRRGKALSSSGCEIHPVKAPTGSNLSRCGGNEAAEALGKKDPEKGFSEHAGRNVNERREVSKMGMWMPTLRVYGEG